jgi:hypothetical protein
MGVLHRLGLMTISEHNEMTQRNVDEANRHISFEVEKRTLQVDETLGEITKWRYDSGELVGSKGGMTIILEVPRSLVVGMAKGQPDISAFAVSRMIHLLQVNLQKAINQLFSTGYNGGDTPQGSYL